jgi:hypothetical protein
MRTVQFIAIVLAALALVPVGAHLLELPHKMALERDGYFLVQSIYSGWSLLGAVLIAAIAANAAAAIAMRAQPAPMFLAGAAALLLLATLVVFFAWVFPANQATANWTTMPSDWETLRRQWEYGHAADAVLTLGALCAATAAALAWRRR